MRFQFVIKITFIITEMTQYDQLAVLGDPERVCLEVYCVTLVCFVLDAGLDLWSTIHKTRPCFKLDLV